MQGSLDNLGYSNTLTLTDEQIIANMNAVQKRFNLPITDGDFNRPYIRVVNVSNGEFLRLGKTMGDIDENVVKRVQIRRDTITETPDVKED
jgi:hypothetical protein